MSIQRSVVEADIKRILSEVLEDASGNKVDVDSIDADTSFETDLGMDSMDMAQALSCVELKYKIVLPEEIVFKLGTLKEAVDVVMESLKGRRPSV